MCNNIISSSGAFITSIGSGIISYTLYSATKDSIITKTAAVCQKIFSSIVVEKTEYIKPVLKMLLPRAMPLTEEVVSSICSVTTKLNSYGSLLAIGTALLSIGAFGFGLSRHLTFKKMKDE